jgi:hypothetical protein
MDWSSFMQTAIAIGSAVGAGVGSFLLTRRDVQRKLDQQQLEEDSRTTTRVAPVFHAGLSEEINRRVDDASSKVRNELVELQRQDSLALRDWIGRWAKESRDSFPSVDLLRDGIDRAAAERDQRWAEHLEGKVIERMSRLREDLIARVDHARSSGVVPDDVRENLEDMRQQHGILKSEFDRLLGELRGAGVIAAMAPAAMLPPAARRSGARRER